MSKGYKYIKENSIGDKKTYVFLYNNKLNFELDKNKFIVTNKMNFQEGGKMYWKI